MNSKDTYDNCRKMTKTDICLFFDHDDGQEWCNYWTKMMSCSQVKLTIDVCDTLISAHEFKLKVNKSKLLVILTTSNMLQFIGDDDSHFESLRKGTCVANIHCHTSEEDMGHLYSDSFISKWNKFVASDEGACNRSIVGDLFELIEKQAKKRRTQIRKFKIMPSHVREIEESIAVIFKGKVPSHVEVSFGADETRHIAKKMNPFTFAFRIPETCEIAGTSRVKVYTDGNYFGEHPITVTRPSLDSYQCTAFLSQILRVPSDNRDALDKALVKVYKKSLPDDDALDCILGDYYGDVSSQRSEHELPTLLHFAAKNGLSELCSVLLDTPGSLAAFQLENRDGCDPADLADKHGHTELCEYLRTFVDVEATVLACEDMYLEMSGKSIYANLQELNSQAGHHEDTFSEDKPKLPDRFRGPQKSSRRHSEPTPNTLRPPLPAPRKSTGKRDPTPEEFMGMTGTEPRVIGKSATLGSTGSAAENDLIGILAAVKDGEFTLNEAERLYESWKKHNHTHSHSIKEKKKALDTLRNEYMSMFDIVKEKNKEKGLFKKLKKKLVKKKSQQSLNISTPTLLRGSTSSQHAKMLYERNSGSSDGSRASGSSQTSASSSDMCFAGSESDALLDDDEEVSSGEDAFHTRRTSPVLERGAEGGAVRLRQSASSTNSTQKRKTMRLEFLETAQSFDEVPPTLPPRNYRQC